jgi:hypothetical protein
MSKTGVMSVSLLVAIGCGGGESGGSAGGAGFTAKIDGQEWAAAPIGISAGPILAVPGAFLVVGSQVVNGKSLGITITMNVVNGPGKYPLGTGTGVFGGTASVGEGTGVGGDANVWQTPLNGLAGTIDITTLSAGRIVATFEFRGEAGRNNMLGGMRTVTEGKIDLPYMGTLPVLAEKVGSKVSATLGGKPYNAWSVNGRLKDFVGGDGVSVDSTSSENALSLMLQGVTGPGTYTLSNMMPVHALTAGKNSNTDATVCCWGAAGDNLDTGQVVITSLTPARVKGTFSGTLQPRKGKPATTPLVVTDGVFDVGIE